MTHATTLSSFVLTMAEDFPGGKNETDDEKNPDLQPEYNVTGPGGPTAKVEACPATNTWTATNGAELWSKRPAYDQSACVFGTRDASDPRARWLTPSPFRSGFSRTSR